MGAVHAKEASSSAQSTRSLDSISAQVVRVHFEGVGRTKEDLLVGNVRPIFDVKHFEELVLKSQDVRNNLKGGFFFFIHLTICCRWLQG